MSNIFMRCLPLVLPSLPLKAFPYLAYIAACLTSLGGPVAMAGDHVDDDNDDHNHDDNHG